MNRYVVSDSLPLYSFVSQGVIWWRKVATSFDKIRCLLVRKKLFRISKKIPDLADRKEVVCLAFVFSVEIAIPTNALQMGKEMFMLVTGLLTVFRFAL